MGDHVVRCRERDLAAAHGMADPALRAGAPLRRLRPALRAGLAPVRARAHPRSADRISCPAGRRRGSDDSALTGAVAVELPQSQGWERTRDLGRDDARRAGRRPASGRLDHRQHRVALDFLHQRAGGPRRCGGHVDNLSHARDGDAKGADRRLRARPARALGGRPADHARQGQGPRLVRLDGDREPRGGGIASDSRSSSCGN